MTANLSTTGCLSKFSPRADHLMQKEVSKNPKISSHDLLRTPGFPVGKMETMPADDLFSTEYRLLKIYHKKRTSRLSPKPIRTLVLNKYLQLPTGIRTAAAANTDAFVQVADQLTHIVDSVSPAQDQVVTESDIIQRLVELMKEYGDKVNEKIEKDQELLRYLQGFFSYTLFEELASAFISSVVPSGKQMKEDNDQKIKIAWTFEMTSRLSALDLQPMNRVMGFGAQYVHQHFAPWIQQHGGWENAFKIDEGDEVQ
ncbi:apoptosis facilitator Bcl-2-like protein 14 isoform X1 [Ictalurus punctatus]|uniref:Apoptosis facilitator Bcl-2-like protein 14 isoform X1 n=2 Tax=Ictalurus punctatus TaxID=7998 RepID=A0A9F7R2G7_ICTPU|nr:apoptosis facilitator Bcl-2-like protein 14 isoform X1 [Ictalurus punctatus]